MDSNILKYEKHRMEQFRPNQKLSALIDHLQMLLGPVQEKIDSKFSCPTKPVIALVGCPRSGITFVSQLLADTGEFSYPSNLLSRFAYAPHIGALIQQMLFNREYDLGDEFEDLRSVEHFTSELGKTRGALGVSEFFHFWRRFFPNHDPGYLTADELESVELDRLRSELASIEAVFEKPFMSKAKMIQHNLDFFSKQIPELRVIHVKRNPDFVMQSLYQARLKYYGTDSIWWSVKPQAYDSLKEFDVFSQIAGQVLCTESEINSKTAELGQDRLLRVQYEDVCDDPKGFITTVSEKFGIPAVASGVGTIQDRYASGNSKRVKDEVYDGLVEAYRNFARNNPGVSC